jgi:uncharacterized DUF497 family protein/predicted DNA binding CopG/RHH family protein
MHKVEFTFEWDEEKNRINIEKHQVSFYKAQKVFYDLNRIILKDIEHSNSENRFFCLGKVEQHILTVRFTIRGNSIRILGAGFGEKGEKFMTKKIRYTKGEIGKVEIINDFLPSPKELVLKKESVKVTLVLSKDSVDFFKSQALNHHVPYQRMIKNLLDKYADSHKKLKKA